jgi:hypothetical protein
MLSQTSLFVHKEPICVCDILEIPHTVTLQQSLLCLLVEFSLQVFVLLKLFGLVLVHLDDLVDAWVEWLSVWVLCNPALNEVKIVLGKFRNTLGSRQDRRQNLSPR